MLKGNLEDLAIQNKTEAVTGEVGLSHTNAWGPESVGDGKERYSVSVITPKNDQKTIGKIEKAIDTATDEGLPKFNGKKPNKKAIRLPLRNGDTEKGDETYADAYFLNANSMVAPQIIDKNVELILDRSEAYLGVYARVSLNFYAYSVNGNRGVAVRSKNIQRLRDGQPLGSRSNVADDLDATDDDDEGLLA